MPLYSFAKSKRGSINKTPTDPVAYQWVLAPTTSTTDTEQLNLKIHLGDLVLPSVQVRKPRKPLVQGPIRLPAPPVGRSPNIHFENELRPNMEPQEKHLGRGLIK